MPRYPEVTAMNCEGLEYFLNRHILHYHFGTCVRKPRLNRLDQSGCRIPCNPATTNIKREGANALKSTRANAIPIPAYEYAGRNEGLHSSRVDKLLHNVLAKLARVGYLHHRKPCK
ncbi:hypothetical protein CaCOL14_003890 [Colletotrichum acutatum]